jgi:hypothetical protein
MVVAVPARAAASDVRAWLTTPTALRVPGITVAFWIIKGLSTAMGESTSDYLVHVMAPVLTYCWDSPAFWCRSLRSSEPLLPLERGARLLVCLRSHATTRCLPCGRPRQAKLGERSRVGQRPSGPGARGADRRRRRVPFGHEAGCAAGAICRRPRGAMSTGHTISDGAYRYEWWRRRESNPGPKPCQAQHLRA